MKILVLGTGGFIGAHLAQRLLEEEHRITGVDTHADKIPEILDHPRFFFAQEDIRTPGFDLDGLVKDADLVVDLIAYANPALYVQMPLEVFRLNFIENLNIAEACVRHGKRLVQFSSSEVYGKTAASFLKDQLIDSDDPTLATFSEDRTPFILGPVGAHRWIYACAKQLLERVLHAYALESKLTYSIIRPFNFIGPKIDYLPSETDGIPRVFSHFMDALIQGTDMKLVEGGHQRRCYTYIDDAVECITRIIENPDGACDGQIFNIGSPDNEVSIRNLAEQMRSIYAEKYRREDVRLPELVEVSGLEFYGAGYEDSDRRIPDISKARTLLGWEPKVTMREMLEKSMAFYVTGQAAETSVPS